MILRILVELDVDPVSATRHYPHMSEDGLAIYAERVVSDGVSVQAAVDRIAMKVLSVELAS